VIGFIESIHLVQSALLKAVKCKEVFLRNKKPLPRHPFRYFKIHKTACKRWVRD